MTATRKVYYFGCAEGDPISDLRRKLQEVRGLVLSDEFPYEPAGLSCWLKVYDRFGRRDSRYFKTWANGFKDQGIVIRIEVEEIKGQPSTPPRRPRSALDQLDQGLEVALSAANRLRDEQSQKGA